MRYSSSEEYYKIIDDFMDKNQGDLSDLVDALIKSLRDITESNDFLATTIENLQNIKNELENELMEINQIESSRDMEEDIK